MQRTVAALKSSSSNRWLARQARDPFVRARDGGAVAGSAGSYRARSAYKLAELSKRYPILGRRVVDLGAAPGGWSQVAAERVRRQYRGKGSVVAVDLLPIEPLQGVHIVQGDFFDSHVQARVLKLLGGDASGVAAQTASSAPSGNTAGQGEQPESTTTPAQAALADAVLSDMMADMSGLRDRDVQASLDLVGAATELAHKVLRPKGDTYPGGTLVLKFFQHPDLVAFRKTELDPYFTRVVTDKPKSSRKESSEAYFVCLGYKGRAA